MTPLNGGGEVPAIWPWDPQWWKPRDCLRDLSRAGALMLAEIERAARAGQSTSPAQQRLLDIIHWGSLRGVW